MKPATKKQGLRNLHVPLPDDLYRDLKGEAARARKPATRLVRQAIEQWLGERRKSRRHEAIVSYARAEAGSATDLDPELEAASIEHLLPRPRGGR